MLCINPQETALLLAQSVYNASSVIHAYVNDVVFHNDINPDGVI